MKHGKRQAGLAHGGLTDECICDSPGERALQRGFKQHEEMVDLHFEKIILAIARRMNLRRQKGRQDWLEAPCCH